MITHLQPLDYWLWAIEFALEALILTFAFRRGMFTLTAYAISRAAFDVMSYVLISKYELVFWMIKPLEYFFCIVLSLDCIGRMVRGDKIYIRLFSLAVAMLATVSVIAAYLLGPMRYGRMLDIEISVNLFLAIGLVVGLLTGTLNKPWKAIALGLIVLSLSDALLGMVTPHFRDYWYVIARAYPVCEIAALVLLLAGPLKGVGEFRRELGKRLEVPKETYKVVM